MKIMKLSSIFLLSLFFIWAFMPQASAKHCKAKHSKSRAFFGLSFNFGSAPRPNYVVAPAPVVVRTPAVIAPAPIVVAPAPVAVYRSVAPVYYVSPYYGTQTVIAPAQNVYLQPSFPYSYLR